ncbi:MAG: S-layer protein, partial [Candidatus Nanohaloarchaea archaeon]
GTIAGTNFAHAETGATANTYDEGEDIFWEQTAGAGTLSTQVDSSVSGDAASAGASLTLLDGTGNLVYNNEDSTGDWVNGEDIFDESVDGEMTYSGGPDNKLAGVTLGNAPATAGTSLTTTNPFTTVMFNDSGTGGQWESGNDVIVTDDDSDGVYTATGDSVVNDEGAADRDAGDNLLTLSTSARFYDKDSSGGYTTGDEVYLDDDSDNVYTGQADNMIGGTAPGAGTSLTTTNPWSQIAFQDDGDSTWESSADIVANDTDTDQTFEAGTDVLIAGSEPGGILKDGSGDKTVYVDVSGHPVKIEFDDSKDEATLSYKTYSQKVAVGDGKTTKSTGYGFSLTTSFNSASGEEKLRVSGSDAQLDTLEGADLGYMTSGGTPYVRVDEDGNGYSANADGEDFKVSYSSGDVNKVLLDGLSDLSSDNKEARTSFGTVVSTGSRGPVSVTHPEKKLQARFAFGSVSESSSGTVKTPTSWPDSAALDSEVSQGERQSQDLILVGGPAVNDLTQQLAQAGKTWTQDQYQANPDVGILDLVNDAFAQGEHALVVAGAQAEDTTAAADFLANYQDHAERLQGKRTVQVSTGQ